MYSVNQKAKFLRTYFYGLYCLNNFFCNFINKAFISYSGKKKEFLAYIASKGLA